MFIFFIFLLKGPNATGVMKFPSLPPGGGPDGYWLDPSGIVWQSNQRKINHIPDYAPVYTSTTTTALPNEEDSRNRYVLILFILCNMHSNINS